MIDSNEKLLLVGDNPFHNISHLSQERARARIEDPTDPKYAASLIEMAVENGANGFTFSVSESTLSILKELGERGIIERLHLYPVVPYAFEYVRLATQLGGLPALARKFGLEMVKSKNLSGIGLGLKGALTANPSSLIKTYLGYEISRIKSSVNKRVCIDSVLLHQLITDMALALDLDWLFDLYVNFILSKKMIPGFNTGNFAFLVDKFVEWNIDLRKVIIAAPFNKVGFQMTPSVEECEKALSALPEPVVIAISILAAGYILPEEAAKYIERLPNIRGIAVGISKEKHARETFSLFKNALGGSNISSTEY